MGRNVVTILKTTCMQEPNMLISIGNMEITEAPVYSANTPTEAEYDKTVRSASRCSGQHIERSRAGEINDDQFRAQRLRRGIYSQRQSGVQMIRTKVPGGTLTAAAQMVQLATVMHSAEAKVTSPRARTCSIILYR